MEIRSDLFYTKDHEWVKVEGNIVAIGITDYAQQALGDIVFVELPDEGDELGQNESFGAVESVKAASDIFAPVSGEIVEVNSELEDEPQLLNEEPYNVFIIKIEMSNPDELEDLLDANDYEAIVSGLE